MTVQNTNRGFIAKKNNNAHTATMPDGESFTCVCARRQDHLVRERERYGCWQDTHPVLFDL